MISNQNNVFCENHFIFRGNSVILQEEKLPDEAVIRKCLELQVAADWFAETEYNYSALLLEKDAPNPAGCSDQPLREYFFSQRQDQETILRVSRARTLLNFRAEKRFCPRCGSRLEDDQRFTARTCPRCGHQFFPQLEPAVIVLVSKGEEILLARHKNRIDSIYACIAGFVEAGETIEHAVAREVKEETGLTIRQPLLCGIEEFKTEDEDRYLMFYYKTDKFKGKLKSSEEGEVFWIKREDLDQYKLSLDLKRILKVMESDELSEIIYYKKGQKWLSRIV